MNINVNYSHGNRAFTLLQVKNGKKVDFRVGFHKERAERGGLLRACNYRTNFKVAQELSKESTVVVQQLCASRRGKPRRTRSTLGKLPDLQVGHGAMESVGDKKETRPRRRAARRARFSTTKQQQDKPMRTMLHT